MAVLNRMLFVLAIPTIGMVICTSSKAVEQEEYRQVMGHGIDQSGVNYGRCDHVTNCDWCMNCLGSCSRKYCSCINGDCECKCRS